MTTSTKWFDLQFLPGDGVLFRLSAGGSSTSHSFEPPVLEMEGRRVVLLPQALTPTRDPQTVGEGIVEHTFGGPVGDGLSLMLHVRVADDSPVLRFRYTLHSTRERRMTKSGGRDAIQYTAYSVAEFPDVIELRLSDYVSMLHTYMPTEVPLRPEAFAAGMSAMGPVLIAGNDTDQLLVAYEHGSTYPDAYLHFQLAEDRAVSLRAVKGNYTTGEVIGPEKPFESIWLQVAAITGSRDALAEHYRHFILYRFAELPATREPRVFYNTWNHQERLFNWHKRSYLAEMNQERMLAEIDIAHRMGVEVFVIDTGWYARTGDWRVNTERFPDGLKSIKERLSAYGMQLGLWFDNAAAVTSEALANHRECVMSKGGKVEEPRPVWETEPSHRMCIVSRYAEAWADELIRLNRELGVTYFKWDAIGQYGCDDPRHDHGDASVSTEERGERFSFLLPLYMTKVAAKVAAACPAAVCDFDMTEKHRCVGLAFLSAGKFFLINNGPYFWDFDIPREKIADGNANLFFFPGAARTWFVRSALAFDRWIPASLTLAHYLPDDPADNQENAVASLVLGQHGIWGDLLAISSDGQSRFRRQLDAWKQVRHDVNAASPVRQGVVGAVGEWHEKLNPQTGAGIVCVFTTEAGTYEYVTSRTVSNGPVLADDVTVTRLPDGRAKVVVTFRPGQRGKMIVFTAESTR